jgi:ASC-1-like (ASCH) protein
MEVNLSDPWFDAVREGTKRVEGRIKRGKWSTVRVGDRWNISSLRGETFSIKVLSIREYPSFEEYIVNEGLRNVLPGITDVSHGVKLYEQYCGKGADLESGVVAFEIEVMH